ncbi:cell wall-binding repeat-containing protein [Quadrisphaera sp. DSM 44207]|uniref:cell wall-binding repeat-containing protein n=1 Tax=Quadrisphaera sp. DSM 44207 TaxID=1881057 RepID=UPI0015A0F7C3|nr:cell wall-binding repeat-containing protein [Quadrisphaera sp. DSM 44207]
MLVGLAATALPARALPFERLEGADRYGTVVRISQDSFPDGADAVVVASGESLPDGLAAAPAAGAFGAPLLLVPRTTTPDAVLAELRRLHPQLVVVAGGDGAVPQPVFDELAREVPETERLWGTGR